jgi:hypothetical protein
MGLHDEEDNKSCDVLEGEMRRRLWWALLLIDTRISQLAEYRSPTFTSAWDCAVPLNVNDSDLRSGMKVAPTESHQATDAIFAVVRAELAVYAKNDSPQANIEDVFETKHIKHCDLGNPLHFMTAWLTRAFLAKFRLFEMYARTATSNVHLETELVAADLHAIRLLECDTKTLTSPMTKPYQWLVSIHFPGPAYVHLLKSLGKRPRNENADRAWQVLSENYEACKRNPTMDFLTISNLSIVRKRANTMCSGYAAKFRTNEGFKHFFANFVRKAWSAREALAFQDGERLTVPPIVSKLRQATGFNDREAESDGNPRGLDPVPASISYNVIPQQEFTSTMDFSMNQFDWPMVDWDIRGSSSW